MTGSGTPNQVIGVENERDAATVKLLQSVKGGTERFGEEVRAEGRSGLLALRAGTAADVPAMYRLDCACFDQASMRRFARRRGAIVLVAESAGELAGFVIVHVDRKMGYVVTLDVAPGWRRMGLARELMESAEVKARQGGAVGMGLHVHVGNAAAIAFYESCGYERGELVRDFYGDGVDAWVYTRP